MTELEGVNIVLAGIGAPPSSALDSSGNSEVTEAEDYLDAETRLVQVRGGNGWWFHRVNEYEAELPDSRFTVTGGSGTFTFDETVTQQTSGATGKFKYLYTSGGTTYMYVKSVSGTFTTGSLTLTGGTSGATKTGASYTAVTTARHAFPRSFWVYFEPSLSEPERPYIQPRGDYLYNADPDDLTFDWTVDLTLNYVPLLDFGDLPESVADYIARSAAFKYKLYKRQTEDPALARMAAMARGRASQEHNRYKRPNIFSGSDGIAVRGEYDRVIGYWG